MNKKLTLAIVALLGFATACSTVKNAPAKGKETPKADSTILRRVIVMYGVRAPIEQVPVDKQLRQDSPARAHQDSPASHVDPVTERPSDQGVPLRSAPTTPAKK